MTLHCIAKQSTAQHPTQSQIASFATWDKSTPPTFLPFGSTTAVIYLAVRFFLIPCEESSFLGHALKMIKDIVTNLQII